MIPFNPVACLVHIISNGRRMAVTRQRSEMRICLSEMRICSSSGLLQSALDDIKRHLSRNGYPRGIISYNMNDVVNKDRNKPKDIIIVPQ